MLKVNEIRSWQFPCFRLKCLRWSAGMSQAFPPVMLPMEIRVSQKNVQSTEKSTASLKAAEPEAQTSLCVLYGL